MPLPTLLSQVLVAFTIELDNEFEHRSPHRTTNHGGSAGPWLVSMAMFLNCMQFIGEDGVSVRDLETLARTKTNLNGMQRWGYIVVTPDGMVRATQKGKKALEIWRPLRAEIEKRWQERFGAGTIARLRDSLLAQDARIDLDLPDCLPILGYGLFSRVAERPRQAVRADLSLPALLSRVLLAFAIEFERESALSLAITSNLLRVLDEKGVRVRDLPLLSGVSKESLSMAMGILEKRHLATVESIDRTKVAQLTARGREMEHASQRLIAATEGRWRADDLRESLEAIVNDPALFRGLEPYPENWRASVRKPETLPHYPMVLHRGGFPDGS